tara:strand:- start:635 stop:1045 length:411 start_codon:yes stop_codon:yes gene_type:complete
MPFKSGKSPKNVAEKINKKLDHIANEQLEESLTAVIYAIGGRADFYVPVDTNALMNSRETFVVKQNDGYTATLGYYQEYALALHGSATYTPLWKPRPRGAPGKPKGGYNPSATPRWIDRGVDETDVDGIFRESMEI